MVSVLDSGCSMELSGWKRNVSGAGASSPCNQSILKVSPYTPEATAAFATAITLMVLFTIVGNIMVIIAVLTSRSLRGPQNLFLVSLAAADILVATLIIPFSLANELLGYWYFKSLWCEIYLALDVLFCTSSIVHLCAISLDRYLSISRVTYGRQRTPKQIKAAILLVWLISAIISFPPLLSLNKSEGGDQGVERGPQCQLNGDSWYILYSTMGSFFAPCLIMILVYIRIYQIAKQRTRCPPGEPRKSGIGCATPSQPPRQEQANGKNEESAHASSNETSKARPPTLSITNSPSIAESQNPQNPTSNNLLQPPPPSPAVAPATVSLDTSRHGPSTFSAGPQSAPAKCKEEGKKGKRQGGKQADNNNGDSSSTDSDMEHSHEGCRGSTSIAGSPPGGGLQPTASVKRYRDVIATSKGARLVPGRESNIMKNPVTVRRKACMVNREKRLTFVLAVVIGVFMVCWFPFFFSYSLKAVCPQTCAIPDSLFTFFFWIGYCNSSLNPVIYTIFNKDFRKAFKKIVCRGTKGTFF